MDGPPPPDDRDRNGFGDRRDDRERGYIRERSRSRERDDRRRYDDRERYRDDRYDRGRRRSRSPRRYRSRSPGDRGGGRGRSRSRSRSPPRRKREKKSGFDDMGGVAMDAGALNLQAQQMMAIQQSQMMGLLPQQQAGSKKQRELYVGNLLVGVVSEAMLREFFHSIVTALPDFDATRGPPIVNVQLSGEGKYAFVECRDEQIAATCMKLDKSELCGRQINVGRPSGYVEPPSSMPKPQGLDIAPVVHMLGPSVGLGVAAAANPAMAANKKQRELYVGNLAMGMVSPDMLRELFTVPLTTMPNYNAAGGPPVLGVDLNPDGKFGFVEFRDEDLANIAIQLFDKMELCGRPLHIGRPRGYIEPGTTPAVNLNPLAALNPALATLGAPAEVATPFLRLENLVDASALEDDAEYKEIVEDIRDECAKNGPVLDIIVPRPGGNNAAQAGKAFVKFVDAGGATKAKQALHGRQFDGNSVIATFISEAELPV